MKRLLEKFEKSFMAVAFAEAGEHDTAMRIAGIKPLRLNALRRFLKTVEACFAAAAFAEENCLQYADPADYLPHQPGRKIRIYTFLKDIGLQNVRVRYGLVPV